MQSLANLNALGNTSVTFVAQDTVYIREGPNQYVARVPTWNIASRLGNVQANGLLVQQEFTWTSANLYPNLSVTTQQPSTVTATITGNTVTFGNIHTVEDYLGSKVIVDIGDHAHGNFRHQGTVSDEVTGNSWQYEILVNVEDMPEFAPGVRGNLVYNFFRFGSNIFPEGIATDNAVTSFSSIAPRIVETGQPAGDFSLTITTQDNANIVIIDSTSNTGVGVVRTGNITTANVTVTGTPVEINGWLGNITFRKANTTVSGSDIRRDGRNLTYTLRDPNAVTVATLTQPYYAKFDIRDQTSNVDLLGNVHYHNQFQRPLWSSQLLPEPSHRLAYVGRHPATGDPHWAMGWMVPNGSVLQVKIWGVQASTGAIQSGINYPAFGNAIIPTNYAYNYIQPRLTSSIDNALSWGSQSNTTVTMTFANAALPTSNVRTSNVVVTTLDYTTGVDAGDVTPFYRTGNVTLQLPTFPIYTGNVVVPLVPGFPDNSLAFHEYRVGNATAGSSFVLDDEMFNSRNAPLPQGIPFAETFNADVYGNVQPSATFLASIQSALSAVESKGAWYAVPGVKRLQNSPSPTVDSIPDPDYYLWNIVGQRGQAVFGWVSTAAVANNTSNPIVITRCSTFPDTAGGQQEVISVAATAGNVIYHDTDLSVVTYPNVTGLTKTIRRGTNGTYPRLASNNISFGEYTELNPAHFLLRGKTYQFLNNVTGTNSRIWITTENRARFGTSWVDTRPPVEAAWISGNYAAYDSSITITPDATTPSIMTLISNQYNTGALTEFQGNRIYVLGPGTTPSGRWPQVPGAMALVKSTANSMILLYTVYTGTPAATYQSAGLYYRRLTVDADRNITWGTPVMIQDPAITGNKYGTTMTASSTVLDGVTIVLAMIAGNTYSSNDCYPVSARITN